MTNLPIAQNTSSPPGGNTNPAQANSSANQAARELPRNSMKPTHSANATPPQHATENAATHETKTETTFATLLARQIDGGATGTPLAAQIGAAEQKNNADSASIEGPEQVKDGIVATADTSGIVSAMLLQIPTTGKATPAIEGNGNPALATLSDLKQQNVAMGNRDPSLSSELSVLQTELIGQVGAQAANNSALSSAQTIGPQSLSVLSAPAPNAPAAVLTQTITTPIGNSGWADDFTQKITWMTSQQSQIAELHLSPPDLGPLDVVLKISGNQATALFTSPHSAVRDAVENALPKLREILADNGIMLGNATVSDQSRQDRGADRAFNQGLGAPARGGDFDGAENLTGLAESDTQNGALRRHLGMVDTFA